MPTISTPDGVSIHYQTFGDDTDPAMVLIQGLAAHMIGWRQELCEQLAHAGYYVTRFDNRDVGQSQHFPAGEYLLTDMAHDTAGLIDALGLTQPVHLVGQSMGGMIAQHLAAEYPDKVASLALVYSAANTDFFVDRDALTDALFAERAQTREQAVDLYVQSQLLSTSPAYPQDLGWLHELGGLMYDRGNDPDGVSRQMTAMLNSPDRTALLARIKVPTTILHGAADSLIDATGSIHLHAHIDRSTLAIYPGMGHELPRPLWDEIVHQLIVNAQSVRPKASVDRR